MRDSVAGKFIAIDGPDGCGKTTQIGLLTEYLEAKGVPVVRTYDPGGTEIGEQIRNLLKYDAKGKMDVHTETMLFMASRAQLVGQVIKPALADGKFVLCDRFVSSTCAYQGAGGYPVKKIIELAEYAIDGLWPDLTIILDIPVEEARARTGQQSGQKTRQFHKDAGQSFLFGNATADRFDSRTLEYHRKVRKGFLSLEGYYPSKVKIVSVEGLGVEEVKNKIIGVLEETNLV